jgi:hypothetical protein
MQHPLSMTMLQPSQQLLQVALYLSFREHYARARGKAGEVMLHILKHKVEAARHSRCDQAFELDHIRMIKASEHLNLSRHETNALRFQIVEANLLQSDNLACLEVARLVHIAVGSLSNFVELFEGGSMAGYPALDGLASDLRQPAGPTGGHLLALQALRHGARARMRLCCM